MPGKNEPFFASLANPTLKSRGCITSRAVITILRFVGGSMRTVLQARGKVSLGAICLPTA